MSNSLEDSSDDEFLPGIDKLEDEGHVEGHLPTGFFDLLNKPLQPSGNWCDKRPTPTSRRVNQLRYNMHETFKSPADDKENNVPSSARSKVNKKNIKM